MKKSLILMPILLLFSQIQNAQTKKGDWISEGAIGNLSVGKTNDQNTYSNTTYLSESRRYGFSFFPKAGYFIKNNFVIGMTLRFFLGGDKYSYTGLDDVIDNDGKSFRSEISATPFFRYYFTGKNTKNRFYGQIGTGWNKLLAAKSEGNYYFNTGVVNQTYSNSSNGEGFYGEALIGFNHFFNEHVALNAAIGYSYSDIMQSSVSTSNYNGLSIISSSRNSYQSSSISWNFGFMFIISRKKEIATPAN